MSKYFTDDDLRHLKKEPFVAWNNNRYEVNLDGDVDPDPEGIYRDGNNKPWANSGRRGRKTIIKKVVEARLAGLSQYEGKPEYSAELEEHKEFKPYTPWIHIDDDGTKHYVDLANTDLVPTKNTNNVASEDEVKKWEESSPEERKVIVDDVLKTLKRRREVRLCTRKGRKNKQTKDTPPVTQSNTTDAPKSDENVSINTVSFVYLSCVDCI